MLLGLGTHLDLFDFHPCGFFLGIGRPLARLILEFAVIHDPANRRFSVGRHLDEIESPLFSSDQCIAHAHDAEHAPFIVDNPNLFGTDGAIDARLFLSYGGTS